MIECRIERIDIIGQEKLLDHFSTVYGVLLRFYPKIDGINCQVNIRGQQELFGRLKEAVQQFCFLTQNVLVINLTLIQTAICSPHLINFLLFIYIGIGGDEDGDVL